MKFLCDNCKAKYQIADEKVSGKTVRMKCRKCGHLIEVRSSVTASVAPPPPEPSAPPAVAAKPAPAARPGVPAPRPSAAARPLAPKPSPAAPAAKPAGGTTGGLARAFKAEVREEAKKPSTPPPPPEDEWYAGINGSPVGPLKLAELKAKLGSASVDEDTLVWREGMEEWVAVRTMPDLLAAMREAKGVVRAAGFAGTPIDDNSRTRVAAPAATAEPTAVADPFAAPLVAAPPAEQASIPIPLVASSPAPAVAPTSVDDDLAPRRRSGGIPPIAWIVVVLALATGVVAGWAFSSKPPAPQPTVQVVTVTQPSASAPGATTGGTDSPDVKVDPAASGSAKAGGPKTATGPIAKVDTTAKGPDVPPVGTTPQVAPLPDVGGPNPGGPSPAGGGPAEQLSSGDIQKVVNNGRNALKRACWEPALAAKPPSAPSSARVQVAMTIGRDGRVSRATPSGGEAFPTLGSCIASRVRAWVFPQAGTDTQTTAVFNFVAQ